MCLHECLEQFNLFGFEATRGRLRIMVGATRQGWTDNQLLDALDVLEEARQSWARFATADLAQSMAAKRLDRNHRGPSQLELRRVWLEGYLSGTRAVAWGVADLGECTKCEHLLIHHGSRRGCAACWASPDIDWDSRCRRRIPAFRRPSPHP